MKTKQCPRCGHDVPVNEFPKYGNVCRPCDNAKQREKYARNKGYHINYRKRNVAKILAYNKQYYSQNREKCLSQIRRRGKQLRDEVFAAYGGKCVCCGEAHVEFLCLDHINGRINGKDPVAKREARSLYTWLRMNGFPKRDDLQILCHNCNQSFGYNGYCPHHPEITRPVR